MMKSARYVFLMIPLLSAVSVATAAAQSPVSRLNVAAQATMLRLSDFGSTSAGVGGRLTFDLSSWASLDGEINFYPRDNFIVASSTVINGNLNLAYKRRRSDVLAGVKIGRSGQRFGFFMKARPGFARLADKGVDCAGEVCALILLARPEYRTEFAFDFGGIAEYYPTVRTFLRVDVGDLLIRHRSSAPPCDGCTSHNLSTRVGAGFRF